jgi:hypothetical protein
MTPRHAILTAVAAGHLALVACSAFGVSLFTPESSGGQAVRLYGALSGSENRYGFFAPGVGAQFRATFRLTDGKGRFWSDVLGPGDNQESRLRFDGSVGMYGNLGPHMATSLAAAMFGRHPDAEVVLVRIEIFNPPTMDQYQAGAPLEWQLIDENVFVRNQAPAAEQEQEP